MWSLYEDSKYLEPLIFSNKKSQEDIVKETLNAIKEGYKTIFIKGKCGSGKSAIALNIAKEFKKTSLVVPIKSLQEQYINDYTNKKYVLKNGRKLKISSIVGRVNFKCKFIEEFGKDFKDDFFKESKKELNLKQFLDQKFSNDRNKAYSCDNDFIPCKIEIKPRNLEKIKEYLKRNPSVRISDFDFVSDVKRMSIAPVCPYWSPIMPEEIEIKKFKDCFKYHYHGLNNKNFLIYERKKGCDYYGQYLAYSDADVIIFNSLKYKIENLMNRKPATEIDIIDECDEFLDSFTMEEKINLTTLNLFLSSLINISKKSLISINRILNTINEIKSKEYSENKIFELKSSPVERLLSEILDSEEIFGLIEGEEQNYLFSLYETADVFKKYLENSFFSIEKKHNSFIINLVSTNLEERFKELSEKNNILIMMSGTLHSEEVLKNVFGIKKFKIIEAETKQPGELIKCYYGYEMNCSYNNFQNNKISREAYLKALSKSISLAKKPLLVHVNSFSDLPTEKEKEDFGLFNLMTQKELLEEQEKDPLGKGIIEFKNRKKDVLFTTKCSRGIDFPGETCNSIVITKFPYPDLSSTFWKIFKKTNPKNFSSFYTDKAKRELLQRIYRGLRTKNDKLYLLSPDKRVLDFEIN